jgi:nucleotide-binding universal stress UspA family protein
MVEAGEAERGAAESYLAQVSTAMGGADWTPVVREGDPATVICDEAERAGADLVVMASEGRSVIGRIFDPSTAEAVVRRSKAPVLVIPVGHDEE